MRKYELVIVAKPSLGDADRKKLLEQVKGLLGKEISVVKEEEWGQKPLAYPIKREVAGVYYRLDLETETSVPTNAEHEFIRNVNILRHLLVRTK